MKKLTKRILASVVLSMAAFAFAPTDIPVTEAAAVQEMPAPVIAKPAEVGKVKQISDYLYAVRYSDLKTDLMNAPETGLGSLFLFREYGSEAKAPGCSAVVNGNYYGRNLDLNLAHYPKFVVWVDGNKDRYASMAVCIDVNVTPQMVNENKFPDKNAYHHGESKMFWDMLPLMAFDGINENGVACNINVVPNDVQNSKGTNPGKLPLKYAFVVRYLLDHAKTAADGVELLKKANIFEPERELSEMHYMISDDKETYVLEIVDDELRVVKNAKIMTNFYLSEPGYTKHAMGIERWNILKAHYAEATSVEGMRHLMERVKYTKAYKEDTYPVWLSETYEEDINTDTPVMEILTKIMPKRYEDYKKATRDKSCGIWETAHTSVYDMKNKTLRITQHEEYDKYFDFKL